MDAPLAVSVVELPAQIVTEVGETVTLGEAFTVIVDVAVFVQPLAVPVTVYVVVVVGEAVTVAPVVVFNPVPGDHV